MREIKREYQRKIDGKYTTTFVQTDKNLVHEDLMNALIGFYLHHRPSTKRITDRCNYDGTRTITVYYDNGSVKDRDVYTIKSNT